MTEGVLESRTWNIQHVSRYHKSKEITSYFPKLFLINNERIFYLLKTKAKIKGGFDKLCRCYANVFCQNNDHNMFNIVKFFY